MKPNDAIRNILSKQDVRDLVMSRIEAVVGGEPPIEYLQYEALAQRLPKNDAARINYESEIKSLVFGVYYSHWEKESQLLWEKNFLTDNGIPSLINLTPTITVSGG